MGGWGASSRDAVQQTFRKRACLNYFRLARELHGPYFFSGWIRPAS